MLEIASFLILVVILDATSSGSEQKVYQSLKSSTNLVCYILFAYF